MIEFGDKYYTFNLDKLDKYVCIYPKANEAKYHEEEKVIQNFDDNNVLLNSSKTIIRTNRIKDVDTVKYDMIRNLIDVVLDTMMNTDGADDEALGADNVLSKKPLAFKIAFNTLLNLGILKEE
jgi:basic membrane lipoprotein Med (substrate-binding protein (PBP1-ABC) superfamily)